MAVQVTTSSSSRLDSSDICIFCLEKDVFRVRMRDCPSINVLVRAQGLVTIFFFFSSTLKTTREESKMSNFHTTVFQNSFVLVS